MNSGLGADVLAGKVAIVTGAAAGFGAEIAKVFAQCGANVVVADVMDEWGDSVVEKIRESGDEAVYRHTDVRNRDDVDGVVAFAEDKYGRLDIMTANAGILGNASFRPSETVTDEDWAEVIDINLTGAFRCFRTRITMRSGVV
jgi:NAD(P)-dependent dehydrogenase (short-subunit alcohol dehydrogenase family)